MRVRISYTVNISEVESEVSELMSRASNDLDDAYQEVIRTQTDLDTNSGNVEENIKLIDFARRKLMKADQVLQDCQLILEGLTQAKQQAKELENEIQDG